MTTRKEIITTFVDEIRTSESHTKILHRLFDVNGRYDNNNTTVARKSVVTFLPPKILHSGILKVYHERQCSRKRIASENTTVETKFVRERA
jgi:hypothetical protein